MDIAKQNEITLSKKSDGYLLCQCLSRIPPCQRGSAKGAGDLCTGRSNSVNILPAKNDSQGKIHVGLINEF
jgi:hypothetical protein